jgi:hypothetical protein
MADVHRPRRIGRHVFDVDGRPLPDVAAAIGGSGSQDRSTSATRSSARSFAAIASASSRGFLRASFASTMAAFVAMSPCATSRGGSTTIRD